MKLEDKSQWEVKPKVELEVGPEVEPEIERDANQNCGPNDINMKRTTSLFNVLSAC